MLWNKVQPSPNLLLVCVFPVGLEKLNVTVSVGCFLFSPWINMIKYLAFPASHLWTVEGSVMMT